MIVVKNLSKVFIKIHIDLICLIHKYKSNMVLDLPKLKLFEKGRCWNKVDPGVRNETNFIMVPEDTGRCLSETLQKRHERPMLASISSKTQICGAQQGGVPSRDSP